MRRFLIGCLAALAALAAKAEEPFVAFVKADKDGNVTPSTVKVTATTAGKAKRVYPLALTVDPLPACAGTARSSLNCRPMGRGQSSAAPCDSTPHNIARRNKK